MYTLSDIPEYKPRKNIGINGDNFFDYFYNLSGVTEPERTIKQCFSVFYNDANFLTAVYSVLAKYDSFSDEWNYWRYPDNNSSFREEHFRGICFANGYDDNDSIYVTEQECFEYTKQACERFLEIHPEQKYRDFLMDILDNWKPLGID